MPEVSWENIRLRRYQNELFLIKNESQTPLKPVYWTRFPENLVLLELSVQLFVKPSDSGLYVRPKSLVEIKFRQEGESIIWHGQRKSLKKLWQAWKVAPWLRSKIPLIYINNQLAAVVGYAISDEFYQNNSIHVYEISMDAMNI